MSRSFRATMYSLLPVLVFAVAGLASRAAYADYPPVRIENRTEYTIRGEVEYASAFCRDDDYSIAPGDTWQGPSRGVCLVIGITGSLSGTPASLRGTGRNSYGERLDVVPYSSTGTSYSRYLVTAYGGAYRIFSEEEYADVTDTRRGRSPGFYFVNETAWPVAYSLDQVGCLHHGIVPTNPSGAGGAVKVETGSVWFTLRVHIQPDGIDPQTDWDCVEPVAEIVGDVAMAAISGGSSAAASAAGAAAKVLVRTVAEKVIREGLKEAGKTIASTMLKDLTADELGKALLDSGSVEMYGQYAGYEWPFRCDSMPEYHITGGPQILRDENGDEYIADGDLFTVTKVNDCGNDMMLGSRRTMSAGESFFSAYREPETHSPPVVGSAATYAHTALEGSRMELSWASLDKEALGYDRRIASWTPNLERQSVSIVQEGGRTYLRADFEGETRELSWASLHSDALGYDRRVAAWTPNLGSQPIEIVHRSGQTFVHATFEGRTRELSWASLGQDRLGYGRKLAVWTPNLGRQPIELD